MTATLNGTRVEVTFESVMPQVATVSSDGVVRAIAPGATYIVARTKTEPQYVRAIQVVVRR